MSERQSAITLIRHGRPLTDRPEWVAGRDLARWWKTYDDAPIDPKSQPPVEVAELARSADTVTSSPLRRAFTSARLLDPSREPVILPDAAEVGSALPGCRLALPARIWSVLARFMWFAGGGTRSETVAEATARAGLVAEKLAFLARERGSVVFVGHGILNYLVGRRLNSSGWVTTQRMSRRHWAAITYRRTHAASQD